MSKSSNPESGGRERVVMGQHKITALQSVASKNCGEIITYLYCHFPRPFTL